MHEVAETGLDADAGHCQPATAFVLHGGGEAGGGVVKSGELSGLTVTVRE